MRRGPVTATLLVALAVSALVLGSRGGSPDRAAPSAVQQGAPPGPETRALSDERLRSRFAFVRRGAVARARPHARARRVTQVDERTQDRTPELVVALEETVGTPRASRWVRVRLPARPNGVTGWVPRRVLGRYHLVTTALRVHRRRMTAELHDRGRVVWSAKVGVGKPAAPTPAGRFYVRSRIIPTDAGGIYGVYAFGTNGFSPGRTDWPGGGFVGLHGTNRPELIPGRVSNGCVRIRNADIARLRDLMPLGTPIEIL